MSWTFKGIKEQIRNREIEGVSGTPLGLAGGMTLMILCASDANPRYKMYGEAYRRQAASLRRAKASEEVQKAFFAKEFAKMFVASWDVRDEETDEPIPCTKEAVEAFLLESDDAIPAILEVYGDTINFRGQRIEVVVAAAKN